MSSPTAATELGATGRTVETMIPRRLDRLPWSRWHTFVVVGLGITWILDGFEVTLVGAIASVLTKPQTLHLTTHQASSAGTWYLIGACGGALFFGYLTARLGRKKLFMVTLGVYLVFTVASALSWSFWSFAIFRILAGSGIGGEYAAITGKRDPGKLPGATNRRLRLFERTPEGSQEVDKGERREHQRERTDPPLDVIVMGPLDPLLFGGDVVRRVADRTRQPADDEERCEGDARQRQQALTRRTAGRFQSGLSGNGFRRQVALRAEADAGVPFAPMERIGASPLKPQIVQ